MKFEIYGKPQFRFDIGQTEVDVLIKLSKWHYDGTCRAMSDVAGLNRVNGILTIWSQSTAHSGTGVVRPEVHAEFRDLDLCLKLMENLMGLDDGEKALARQLRLAFRRALHQSNIVVGEWRTEISGAP